MSRLKSIGAVLLLSGLFIGCGEEEGGDLDAQAGPVLETYADVVHASYEDSRSTAVALDGALDALVATPSDATLSAAREAWLSARDPYGQTEVYRFYGGPIEQGEPEREGALNAWPMDESTIDYVAGMDTAGLINDTATTIDQATLEGLNGDPGEANVTTGYHSIEFLLWGQDDSAVAGAGQRPFTDYVTDGSGTAANQDRRGQYLTLVSDILQEDLQELIDAWAPGTAGNYRETFVASGRDGLRDILLGMGSLSGAELAGERMNVAFMTMDQEDEHSCFSDNTHNDVLMNATGIRNVYLGTYRRVDGSTVTGASLSELVAARDPDLDATMRMQLDASVAAAQAIPAPFDEALVDDAGRAAISAAIDALRAQTTTIVQIATLFEITLNLEE